MGASAAAPRRDVPTRANAARGHSSRKALAFAHPTQKSSLYYQNLMLVNSV
jgi:hypothetical protein